MSSSKAKLTPGNISLWITILIHMYKKLKQLNILTTLYTTCNRNDFAVREAIESAFTIIQSPRLYTDVWVCRFWRSNHQPTMKRKKIKNRIIMLPFDCEKYIIIQKLFNTCIRIK